MSQSQMLIDFKDSVRDRTMEVIKRIPEDKLNWRPVEGVLTLGQQVHHIGQADMAWNKVLSRAWGLGEFLQARMKMDLLEVIGDVKSLTDEIQSLEITHQEFIKWIGSQTDADLEQVYEGAGFSRTAREIVLGLCEHEGHHRGQIVTYLRLLDIRAPRPWGF